MTILALIALGLLASAGVLWRELRRAPLLPPGYNADGEPIAPEYPGDRYYAEEKRPQPQETRS